MPAATPQLRWDRTRALRVAGGDIVARVKRSLQEVKLYQAAMYEDCIVNEILRALGTKQKHFQNRLMRRSRSHGDGWGKKLADLYRLMPGFPLLLGARQFHQIRRKCPTGKLLQILPSLEPAKQLERIRAKYDSSDCDEKRAVSDVGVVFRWPHMEDMLVLHTMPPDFDGAGTQLTCQLSVDQWLVLEPFPKLLRRLVKKQEEWDPTAKHADTGSQNSASRVGEKPLTKRRDCQ